MPEIFQYSFMVRAYLAGAAIGMLCPALGTFLVLRRLSLIADTLSHVALAGVAIGLYLRAYPPLVAVVTSAIAAASIEWLRSTGRLYGEVALAVFLYASLAVAVVLISLGQGFNVDLFGYLFGSILTVGEQDLWLIGGIALAVAITVVVFYAELVQTTFDQDLARVSGLPVERVNLLLVVLSGITVAVAMRIVGVLLVGALIVIPVISSLQVSRGFRMTLLVAIGMGLFSVLAGLTLAYYLDLAAGGAIVLTSLALLGVVSLGKGLLALLLRGSGAGGPG